jgi:hypothetical protein
MQSLLLTAGALVASLAAGSILAQTSPTSTSQPTPTGAGASAWETFQQEAGNGWLVAWHAATGTPRAIWGAGLELADWRANSLEEARRHAHLQLQVRSELLGLDGSELRERVGARMGRTWTFTFEQWFAGLPVIGGRADVRIHMRGRLVHLGSTAWPIAADFDTKPVIGETQATGIAWLGAGCEPTTAQQPGVLRANRLVVWGDAEAKAATTCHLAWEIPISAVDANGHGPIGTAYVDAKTGALLRFVNEKHECGLPGCGAATVPHASAATPPTALPVPTTFTVMGWTHTGISPVSTPTNAPLVGLEVVVPGFGTQVTDQNGQFTVDLVAPTSIAIGLNGVHSSLVQGANALTLATTLQPGQPATLQLGTAAATEQELAHTTTYYWTHRINEWARGILGNSPELTIADAVFPTVNIASTCNAYYTGNSINFYASGGGCNNTSGASVVAHEWGHGLDDRYAGISQTNGLSEGWGDICSMYLLDDPLIGHDFFSGGGGLRNGNNNQQYPNGGGPHDQGLSWMGFAWKLRQNLRNTLGPAAIALSNDIVVASIAACANNQPDAVVAAFQADDDDGLLGNGTPHYTELVAACNSHSLPYPPLTNGYLQHTQLATTYQQLIGRRVEIDAVPFAGSFTQVRVHWNDGAPQQRNLVPQGTANRWHGLVPGHLAPKTVLYHFEAQHSSGATLRLPASGEYLYLTLAERRIWLENFETGGVGWTHGATTGTDDWEVGAPAGRTGFGWFDPTAAFSGSNCAGNDLGQTSDGAYAANSDTWLRSPPIDCTGFAGVRMRLKRQISCAGPTDRVDVRCNGVLVWTSSFTLLHDTGWVNQEFVLATADNHPAAVLEFRLISAGPIQYGGWNLDDIEIYTLAAPAPPVATLTLNPEQAAQGTPVTIAVTALPSRPFVLALGDTAGPTSVPGFPTVQVGGGIFLLADATDAAGQWSLGFVVPPSPSIGTFWYSQVLTLDASNELITTNPFENLFTQ